MSLMYNPTSHFLLQQLARGKNQRTKNDRNQTILWGFFFSKTDTLQGTRLGSHKFPLGPEKLWLGVAPFIPGKRKQLENTLVG